MSSKCQNCDAPLPASSPGGLCPACLMGEAVDSLETAPGGPSLNETTTIEDLPAGPDPLEGTTLGIGGRYRILQRIGEGGFGTVYMAEQSVPVRRRVAIKILKAGMDTRQVVARFEAERQALAMMDHPCIAKVLDGGETEQGRPFFVMELVRGTPLTAFCDREGLDPQARLQLFLKVCRAVQHAHQKGIIHRDLKPGNVLVTVEEGAEPVPKVIDFGVAKAMESNLTDKTLFTRFEQMIGTPAYMSPEQAGTDAASDVDTRADIYALGVLLYELLTGTTPFDPKTLQSAAYDEVRRILREEEAPRPSARLSSMQVERRTTIAKDRGTEANSLGKHLRGDLDWIVMKAIEKDRRRRYETANALALDVERHMQSEPVAAGPPTVAYRMGKFLRRNRLAVGIAATIVLSLLAGLGLALAGFATARGEARNARAAEREAEEARESSQLINDFLVQDLLGQADPNLAAPDSQLTMRDALDRAAATIDQRFADRPATRAEIHALVGRAYELVGAPESALRHSEEHREFIEREIGVQSAAALRAQAHGARQLGDPDNRIEILRNVLAAQRKLLGNEHVDTLNTMSWLAVDTLETPEGLAVSRERLELLQTHQPEDRKTIAYAKKLLGKALSNNGKPEEAVEMLNAAIADFESFGKTTETELQIKAAQEQIGYATKDKNTVFESLREGLERAQQTYGPESAEAIRWYSQLGWALGQVGSYDEAKEGVRLLEKALALHKRHNPRNLSGRGYFEICLKACQDRIGLHQDAIDLLTGTLREIRESGFQGAAGKYSEETYVNRLHSLYFRNHNVLGAEEVFRPSVEAAVSAEGFEAGTTSNYYRFLCKCRFVTEGEEGLRSLLRDLGRLSNPPIVDAELEPHIRKGIEDGVLHAAFLKARIGDWKRARELLDQHRELGGTWEDRNVFIGYGALVLRLGDHEAHRNHCAEALQRYEHSEILPELNLTAILFLLDPDENKSELHQTGARLAERSLELNRQKNGPKKFSTLTVFATGLAKLRTGQGDDAWKNLEGAIQVDQPIVQSAMHSCLAIRDIRNGDRESGQKHIEEAERLIGMWTMWKEEWPERWNHRLVAEILRDEARAEFEKEQ